MLVLRFIQKILFLSFPWLSSLRNQTCCCLNDQLQNENTALTSSCLCNPEEHVKIGIKFSFYIGNPLASQSGKKNPSAPECKKREGENRTAVPESPSVAQAFSQAV